jgi:hypothetical protein
MSKKLQFNRYVPIALKKALDKLDYSRKDNLYTIIDLIYRKEIYFKSDLQKIYGYTEISKEQFKELLPSSDNLNDDINFLVDNGFIRRNDFYTIGIKPKSYKISSEYMGKSLPVKITNDNINNRIAKQIIRNKRLKVKRLEFVKSEYFKNFKIDVEGANKAILDKATQEIKLLCKRLNFPISTEQTHAIINCDESCVDYRTELLLSAGKELKNILHRYMGSSMRITAIGDGFLFFKRNKTNGRLDSNLTSLPSYLRPFIQSDELLFNIDFINSQPFFLYTLLKTHKGIDPEELELYKELVLNGNLYDALLLDYNQKNKKNWIRKQMKNMVFKIFYSKSTSYKNYKNFFASWFPTIMDFINKTNSKSNSVLAVKMQTLESHAVLDVIMPELEKIYIKPFTIHDSFLCKESQVDLIVSIVNQKMEDLFGCSPALKVENVNTQVQEEDIVEHWNFDDIVDLDDEEELNLEPIQIKTPVISKADKQKVIDALMSFNMDDEFGF